MDGYDAQILATERQLRAARRTLRRLARRHPDGSPAHLSAVRHVHALYAQNCALHAAARRDLFDRLMGDDQ